MKSVLARSKPCAADILILGAGPAGCAAAISARLAGMSVILLEPQRTPASVPGETLHPGLEPIFKQLGVWDSVLQQRFHRHRGIWREEQNGQRRFEEYGSDGDGPWLGFQVDRARLTGILRARVVHLAGTIVHEAKPGGLLTEEVGVVGVTANGQAYRAPFVLDATGRRAWLAAQLALAPERHSPLGIRFGWTKNDLPELEGQPLFRQRPDGWDWLSPLGDGRCSWVKLRRGTANSGMDYSWRLFRECAGPGYFLLGDAAGLMDPSTANGVLRAMMSGLYAVHLISKTNEGLVSSTQAAAEYKKWMGELFDYSSKELATSR